MKPSPTSAPSIRPWIGSHRVRLILLSFLMLFLELALIRWLGENVVYLSFFTNIVLLGSFLGIGLGFLSADRPGNLRWLPISLFALVGFVLVFPAEIDRSGAEVIYFGSPEVSGLPLWIMLPLIFLAVVWILFLVGQAVARVFRQFDPLVAYRLDIMGSILGIVVFAILSWLQTPPVVWAFIVLVLLLMLAPQEMRGRSLLLMVGTVVVLGAQSLAPGSSWSPYYRVQVVDTSAATLINVNGIPHQTMTTVEHRASTEPLYLVPYDLIPTSPERVLIVGSGTGTDVAIALAEGADRVDAVEIDPRLYELGREMHPDAPYSDERVRVHIDDGRAFMERSDGGYDLILFALPDSLTLVSGQSSLRLESFLFTQEAVSAAHDLLAPGGVFAMYNYYREDWLVDRLAATLAGEFGSDLCVVAPSGAVGLALLAGGSGVNSRCPSGEIRDLSAAPSPVTDDYPFLYIRSPGIPSIYLIAMASILAVSFLAIRSAGGTLRSVSSHLDLFLMGTAFLLLETKSIVQFSLWFGTTWVVNALVFAGVLLSVLAAIEITRLKALPPPGALYGLLILSIILAWAVPPALLLDLPAAPRFASAILLTFTPIFVANLLFAQRFASVQNPANAFGVNLLGAMGGGVLEYLSLVIGYRALSIAVGILYLGAFVAWRRLLGQPGSGGHLRPPVPSRDFAHPNAGDAG